MTLRKLARLGLTCILILAALAACVPATPTPEPTATVTATQPPTNTPEPTQTPEPSATPAVAETSTTAEAGDPGAETAAAPTTAAANPAAGSAAPDKYQYLGQDIPDGTQFLPGRQVTITWTVKNIGTNGWTKEYTLRYFSGPEPSKTIYTFTKDVPANDTVNFVVTFTTPDQPGDYNLWFKLTNLAGQNFGDVNLVYTVSNNPVKITATTAP